MKLDRIHFCIIKKFRLSGSWRIYFSNGKLSYELNYKNGELEGLCRSYMRITTKMECV